MLQATYKPRTNLSLSLSLFSVFLSLSLSHLSKNLSLHGREKIAHHHTLLEESELTPLASRQYSI